MLTGVPISTFEEAIRSAHGATAQFLSRQIIREFAEGKVVWEGEVLTFQLLDPSHRVQVLRLGEGRGDHARARGAPGEFGDRCRAVCDPLGCEMIGSPRR
jgi:hypothetical protein